MAEWIYAQNKAEMSCKKCREVYIKNYNRLPPCEAGTLYQGLLPEYKSCQPRIDTDIAYEVTEVLNHFNDALLVATDGMGGLKPSEVFSLLEFKGVSKDIAEMVWELILYYKSLEAKDRGSETNKA